MAFAFDQNCGQHLEAATGLRCCAGPHVHGPWTWLCIAMWMPGHVATLKCSPRSNPRTSPKLTVSSYWLLPLKGALPPPKCIAWGRAGSPGMLQQPHATLLPTQSPDIPRSPRKCLLGTSCPNPENVHGLAGAEVELLAREIGRQKLPSPLLWLLRMCVIAASASNTVPGNRLLRKSLPLEICQPARP